MRRVSMVSTLCLVPVLAGQRRQTRKGGRERERGEGDNAVQIMGVFLENGTTEKGKVAQQQGDAQLTRRQRVGEHLINL